MSDRLAEIRARLEADWVLTYNDAKCLLERLARAERVAAASRELAAELEDLFHGHEREADEALAARGITDALAYRKLRRELTGYGMLQEEPDGR